MLNAIHVWAKCSPSTDFNAVFLEIVEYNTWFVDDCLVERLHVLNVFPLVLWMVQQNFQISLQCRSVHSGFLSGRSKKCVSHQCYCIFWCIYHIHKAWWCFGNYLSVPTRAFIWPISKRISQFGVLFTSYRNYWQNLMISSSEWSLGDAYYCMIVTFACALLNLAVINLSFTCYQSVRHFWDFPS